MATSSIALITSHLKTSHLAHGYWPQLTATSPKTRSLYVSLTRASAAPVGLSPFMQENGSLSALTMGFSAISTQNRRSMQLFFLQTQHIICHMSVQPFMVVISLRRLALTWRVDWLAPSMNLGHRWTQLHCSAWRSGLPAAGEQALIRISFTSITSET